MPDLNSVPASPRPQESLSGRSDNNTNSVKMATATSSAQAAASSVAPASMIAPPSSSSSLNILPSNQTAVNHQHQLGSNAVSSVPSPHLTPTQLAQQSETSGGPGPLRHPRPMTASELHMQLEKEQEALVNRLTRELSLLRASHNASVASNASSVSAANSNHDPLAAEASLLSGSGFSIPSARRHQRTSSTASQSHQLSSSFEGRGTHFPRPPAPPPLSRQDSCASRSSQAAASGSAHHSGDRCGGIAGLDPWNYIHSQRVPYHQPGSSVAATPASTYGGLGSDHASPALMPATMRYEETAFYRNELETAKKENDILKKRVRELEKLVRERRESSASHHTRSASVSTTASASVVPTGGSSIAGPRDRADLSRDKSRASTRQSNVSVAVGVPEEEVKFGESAASYATRS